MTRVVLVSTYELGAQPLGCAAPAAALRAAGHEVRMHDLAVESWPEDDFTWAQAVAISVPMHTALRLGLSAVKRLRREHPGLPVALHGLYAPVASISLDFELRDLLCAKDSESALVAWASLLEEPQNLGPSKKDGERDAVRVELAGANRTKAGRPFTGVPYRDGLPDLSRYARLLWNGSEHLVGSVEATRGCHHRCRHCPVPVIYKGRTSPIELADLMCDIDNLVDAGAEHIHFADPDFLSRPAHANRVVDALHKNHDGVSFDITVKVSHILEHLELWEKFASAGLCFVISAFESTSDVVLSRLDKGHTAIDAAEAVDVLRTVGVEIRPSLLPFTPWTKRADLLELFDFVAANDLVFNVDAIQYGIRLLLPPGSLLLEEQDPVLSACLGSFDEQGLGITWRSPDPLLDDIASALAALAERAESLGWAPEVAYAELRALLYSMLGRIDPGLPAIRSIPGGRGTHRPRLSEAWFCCAEPTARQRDLLSSTP